MEDERYRLLVEAITDYAIYMIDAAGIVSSWNSGAERFKGYKAGEIIGRHFSQFYTDEDKARGLPSYALETAAREGKFESEGWRVRKDGTRFWASVIIDPIRSPAGDIVGFAKITRDLTDRKAAEDALRRSEEQFKLLVRGVTDYAIYLLTPDGHVASWNLGAERIKGYLADEIIGSHFSQFYLPEERARGEPQRALETARREGRFEKEGQRVRKDGSTFWAHVIIDTVHNDHGDLIGFAKITRDITERREAQHSLERTREALLQSQKMEAIGQLTGGVAHDFNNLLMAVLSSLELMRKRLPHDPKLSMLLENAVQGAQRGAALTKRMLAFARRQELKQETIHIPELVLGMRDLLQRSLGPTIAIETRFALGSRPVLADANQLEMILLNLAVNARDAMPEGGQITITSTEKNVTTGNAGIKPGSYLCLSITDTGTGMDEETLRRATEPFFTTKGPGKGTGLGLSMVHGIVEQSGGVFLLKSRLNEGTTAELWLPIAPQDTDAQDDTEAADEKQSPFRPLTVVAVDDDFLVLTNTVAMLEDLGHTVLPASSAKEALAILRKERSVDLVVTDQAMPNVTGLQLAGAISSEWPGLPVIIATGYAELDETADVKFSRISKPFSEADLVEAIWRAVPPRGADL